ncbi:rolling circle replication-associated protein [Agathobaculum desmolans]|mgnify:CR=1 FL=1|uniref:rolling circle replication-associated protein n=1 Tax=Agathobaculum desmolans TaxID=39484 RepID=UPI0004E1D243|nr:hypothetical protein [Agathobaculum desmolans]
MVNQKEEANGNLYQLSLFTGGCLPGLSPRQRQKRQKQTEEYKKKINDRAALWRLMQIICANFLEMRDLFVCLTYAEAPENEGRCLEAFHRKIKRALAKLGVEHGYVAVTTDHALPDADTEVRVHHHLIMHGAIGPAMYIKIRDEIARCWPHGTVDVRPLRQNEEFFRDTAQYFLQQPVAKGARRYSTSRNLRPPNEPIRLRLPEEAAGEIPPGVVVIEDEQVANEFGHYRYLVGRIYDRVAFDRYWQQQRKKAAPDPWERLRRRRRIGGIQYPLYTKHGS